jgi:hypothetical protein
LVTDVIIANPMNDASTEFRFNKSTKIYHHSNVILHQNDPCSFSNILSVNAMRQKMKRRKIMAEKFYHIRAWSGGG